MLFASVGRFSAEITACLAPVVARMVSWHCTFAGQLTVRVAVGRRVPSRRISHDSLAPLADALIRILLARSKAPCTPSEPLQCDCWIETLCECGVEDRKGTCDFSSSSTARTLASSVMEACCSSLCASVIQMYCSKELSVVLGKTSRGAMAGVSPVQVRASIHNTQGKIIT